MTESGRVGERADQFMASRFLFCSFCSSCCFSRGACSPETTTTIFLLSCRLCQCFSATTTRVYFNDTNHSLALSFDLIQIICCPVDGRPTAGQLRGGKDEAVFYSEDERERDRELVFSGTFCTRPSRCQNVFAPV